MTPRIRIGLVVSGALAVVLAVTWLAITNHIAHLRNSAAHSTGDAAPELVADAQGFRAAQTAFAITTVVLILIFVALVAMSASKTRRAHRCA